MTRALAAALLVACGAPARLAEPTTHPTPWCVSMTGEMPSGDAYGIVCLDRLAACDRVRELAVRFAGIGHITVVGGCRLVSR